MARLWKIPGPLGSRIFTLPHADIKFRSAFDADYSLPRLHLLHITAPRCIEVEFCCSQRNDLGPDYKRLPDDQAREIITKVDEELKKRGTPDNRPGVRHVYVHFAIGPQIVYHQPFKHADPRDPLNSAEADATAAVDITLLWHRDDPPYDKPGLEFTATLQGSANFIVLDPNRDNPDIKMPSELARSDHARQGQLQLQLAYYWRTFSVLGTDLALSFLLQAAGAAAYQYDPTKKQAGMSYSLGLAPGAGLDIKINDQTSIGPQLTVGPTGQFDGRFNPTGATVDFTFSAVLKSQFELGPKPPPKKK